MRYVYGPIPSRRLGKSLGVDPIPLKTCNWNCVYCQLGRTSSFVTERGEYTPAADIVAEVAEALERHHPGEIDYISFVGSGEPTLHSQLGWMIRRVKEITSIPLAVITNGALLYRPDVRADLLPAHVVMPTLTAGTERLYLRINRPHPDLTFQRLLDGLRAFRQEYTGQLWVEVMLIRGLNDQQGELYALADALQSIRPDQVHLTLPDRPPSEDWVQPPTEQGILDAVAILGEIAHVVHPAQAEFDLSGHATLADAVVAIITRHPMSERQLLCALDKAAPQRAQAIMAELQESRRVQVVERCGVRFWATADQRFAPHRQAGQTER